MELDAIMAVQNGRVLVREAAPLERLAAELRAECEHVVLGRRGALAPEPLEQGRVAGDEVVVAKRGRLVRRAEGHDQPCSSAGSACAACVAPAVRNKATPIAAAARAKIAPTRNARW